MRAHELVGNLKKFLYIFGSCTGAKVTAHSRTSSTTSHTLDFSKLHVIFSVGVVRIVKILLVGSAYEPATAYRIQITVFVFFLSFGLLPERLQIRGF